MTSGRNTECKNTFYYKIKEKGKDWEETAVDYSSSF